MAVKVGLYLAREGRESSARTSVGKDGGKFVGQKGKLATIEEGPQLDSVATVVEEKSYKI